MINANTLIIISGENGLVNLSGLLHKKKEEEEPIPQEVMDAYEKAKTERRIENAKAKGIQDADKIANYQPFYKKLLNGAQWIVKDLSEGAAKTNPDVLFTFDEPKKKKRR